MQPPAARFHLSSLSLTSTVILLLSFCLPFSTLVSHYQRCHVREWVLRQQRRVTLCLQRDQLNLRLLFETYTPKSLPPHTLSIAHSQCHLQSYTFTEQSMGGELCFHDVFIWLIEKQGNLLKHNVAPWWHPGVVQYALQRFSSLSLLPSAVLSFCSHSLGLDCQVCNWFNVLRKTLHTEVASKGCRRLFGEADGLPC